MEKKSNPYLLLRSFIKRQLKIRRLTYKDLSLLMGVSEITVKRWLSQRDFSIGTLIKIGKILEFDVFDFVHANYQAPIHFQYYTSQQENCLISEPKAGLVLLKLIYNHSAEQIQTELNLSNTEFLRILRRLDKLKFLELHSEDKIHFVMKGPFRSKENSRFNIKYFPKMREYVFHYFTKNFSQIKESSDLKDFEICRPFEMYMSRNSATQFSKELIQLLAKYRQLTMLEVKNGKQMQPVAGFLGVAEYDLWKDTFLNRVYK